MFVKDFVEKKCSEQNLFRFFMLLSIIWVIAQIGLIITYWGVEQHSDMKTHIEMATRCFNNNGWYPMEKDIYSAYIVAPAYINFLILQLHIFGSVNFNAIINLIMNILMLFCIYSIGKQFFSKRAAIFTGIIFCLLHSNFFIILGAYTENPFLFLALTSLYFVFTKNWKYIAVAGIFFALANAIRPLVIIYFISAIFYLFMSKSKIYNYIALVIPCLLTILIIGKLNEIKTGYFIYQSSTSGANLFLSAYEATQGSVTVKNWSEIQRIENESTMTFAERNQIWKEKAITFIKEKPLKFAMYFFLKIPALFIHDHWSTQALGRQSSAREFLAGDSSKKYTFYKEMTSRVLISTPYYLAFISFFYVMLVRRNEMLSIKSTFLLLFILGTGMTCIVPASPRYHYAFLFPILLYGGWGIDTLFEKYLRDKDRAN